MKHLRHDARGWVACDRDGQPLPGARYSHGYPGVLAGLERASVDLADQPRGRQEAQDVPLAQRVEQTKAALRGQRPATFSELSRQRAEEADRALAAETRQDRELAERVSDARQALGLR